MNTCHRIGTVFLIVLVLGLATSFTGRAQDSPGILEQSSSLLKKRKYVEARSLIEIELAGNTNADTTTQAGLLSNLARALSQLKESRASINTWHTLLGLVPEDTTAWFKLGKEFYGSGDLDSAILATEHCLKLDSTHARALGDMGLYMLAKGDIDGMQQYYSRTTRHVRDVKTWTAIRSDIDSFCTDSMQTDCTAAGSALDTGWKRVLNRWYEEAISKHDSGDERIWSELKERMKELIRGGYHADGIAFGQRALTYAREKFGQDDPVYATSLMDVGYSYKSIRRYAEAEPLYLEAKKIRKEQLGQDHPKYAITLNNLAVLYDVMTRYADAEPLYLEAKRIYSKQLGPNYLKYATTLNNLARLYQKTGRYNQAEPLYVEAKKIRKEQLGPDHPKYASTLNKLATLYKAMGKYAAAEPLYLETKRIYHVQFGKDHPKYATILNNLARLYFSMGRYTQAESMYLEAKRIRKEQLGQNHPSYATSLNSLAGLYELMGRYAEAELLYLEAKRIRKEQLGQDHPDYAYSLHSLAGLYELMGRHTEAELMYLEAKKIIKVTFGKDHPDYATSLNSLAVLYISMGRYAEAEPLLLQAKKIYSKMFGQDHPDYAILLYSLAGLYISMERYAEAEPLLLGTKRIFNEQLGSDHPLNVGPLFTLAVLYKSVGKYSMAEPLLLAVKEIDSASIGTNHPSYATGLNELALLYKIMDRHDDAEALIREAGDIIERNLEENFSSIGKKEREQYFTRFERYFEGYNSFFIQRMKRKPGILKEMLNRRLAMKGRLFNATRLFRERIRTSGDTTLQALEKLWFSAREEQTAILRMSAKHRARAGMNPDSLRTRTLELEKELSRRSSSFARTHQRPRVRWQELRDSLKPGEAAVEIVRFNLLTYHWTDTVFYAALIITEHTREHPVAVLLKNGIELEGSGLLRYMNALQDAFAADPVSPFNLYWRAIDSALGAAKTVYLSPDGVYNQINIETLYRPDKTFVGDTREIRLLQSTRDVVLRNQGEPTNYAKTAVIIGNPDFDLSSEQHVQLAALFRDESRLRSQLPDTFRTGRNTQWTPLPGTSREIDRITDLLGKKQWNVDRLEGANALEEAVKSISGPRVLHLATHGYFLERRNLDAGLKSGTDLFGIGVKHYIENPLLRSGIVLAGANTRKEGPYNTEDPDDGLLTAEEAMMLDLDGTELVVLSACETGKGKVKNGEGVYGLQRALMLAGARNVLMSLWKVSDEATTELMTSFYTHWLSGSTPKQALRQAQKDLRKTWPEPYYWGAFVLMEGGEN